MRAVSEVGDGDWSDTATGTPSATAIDPAVSPVAVTFLNPNDTCGTSRDTTSNVPPDHLDVIPEANRTAILVWRGSNQATEYYVQVKRRRNLIWGLPYLDQDEIRAGKVRGVVNDTCLTIKLDEITTEGTSSDPIGLGDYNAYDFQVRAKYAGGDSQYSEVVTIIDTSIVAINGHSPGSDGEAELAWTNIEKILRASQGFSQGDYSFRYRKFAGTHSTETWEPTSFDGGTSSYGVFEPTRPSPDTITTIDAGAIYAIQFKWERQRSPRTLRVFAARDAYVWPSGAAPNNGEYIATFPIYDAFPSKVFKYRICTRTFPKDTREQWARLIPHAFGQWEGVGNQWGEANSLVTFKLESEPCAPFSDLLRQVADRVESAVAASMGVEKLSDAQVTQINLDVETIVDGYDVSSAKDRMYNEVLLFDDVTFNIDDLIHVVLLPQMAPEVGHFWCWGDLSGNDFHKDSTLACVVRSTDNGVVLSNDLFLRHSKMGPPGDLVIPGGDLDVQKSDVRFNICPATGNNAYAILVHEAGHLLGVRGPSAVGVPGLRHPTIPGTVSMPTVSGTSIMAEGLRAKDGCSPHPFDVMVLYAIYQSRWADT